MIYVVHVDVVVDVDVLTVCQCRDVSDRLPAVTLTDTVTDTDTDTVTDTDTDTVTAGRRSLTSRHWHTGTAAALARTDGNCGGVQCQWQ